MLQREVAALQAEIATLIEWLAPPADNASPRPSTPGATPESVRSRIERLAETSARLGEDFELQWMTNTLIEGQMRLWEREQRVFAVILGAATLLAGWLIPLLAASGTIA